MKSHWPTLLLSLVAFGAAADVHGAAPPAVSNEARIARIQRLVFDTTVDVPGFDEKTTLAKYLAALEASLPKGKKVSLRIDAKAFGKQLPRLAAATLKVQPAHKVHLASLLRRVVSRVNWPEELDFAVRPTGVEITKAPLAAHRVAYDVCDLVPHLPLLLPRLQKWVAAEQDVEPASGPAVLPAFLLRSVKFRSWERVEVLNRVRLVVVASPTRQEEVADLLGTLRRMSDVAVVMNARLYEVDRAFYVKHVAPLFARYKGAEKRPTVLPVDGRLLKQVVRQKLLLESEDVKIQPGQESTFLARQSVYRYVSGAPGKEGRPRIGVGLAGVSFSVRPLVSPDRRYLRLGITQKSTSLVRIDKTTMLDVGTGKDVTVETPSVRRSTVTDTLDIGDGVSILMPVDHRPAGKENADKVWLLVAVPIIWIEEEMAERRKEGLDMSSKTVWNMAVEEVGQVPPPTPLAFNDEVKEVLQAIVNDVLTNPALKGARESHGNPKDRTFAQVDGGKLAWPKEFTPAPPGWKMVKARFDPFVRERRVLGIRLDKFDLKQTKAGPRDAPVVVCVCNAVEDVYGADLGGCLAYYLPRRSGKRWTVNLVEVHDP